MSEAPDGYHATAGEELFLAHLAAQSSATESDVDEYDVSAKPSQRKPRGVSIGEELWMVHCKRAKGVELETDDEKIFQKSPSKKIKASFSPSPSSKSIRTRGDDRVLQLRNRDVKVN